MKQRNKYQKPTYHTLKKACYAAVAALMLQACQSTDVAQHQAITPIKSTALLFSDNPNTSASTAKSALISAMQNHLSSERYVLSTYQYRALPHVAPDSIDAGSDSLWTTAIKTHEFKTNRDNSAYQSDAYRTSESYLAEDASLPYLRYGDELAGTVPDHALPREVAMDTAYQAHKEEIYDRYSKLRSCLVDASISIDEIVQENPDVNTNHRAIISALADVDGCINTANQALEKLQADAQSYQFGDIHSIRQCAQTFRTDLRTALAVSRKNKSLTDEAYDGYDMAWQKFKSCNEPYVGNAQYFEPYEQILNGYDKGQLDARHAAVACIHTENQAYQALSANGKTLANDPDAYLQTYFQSAHCQALAMNEVYPLDDEITMPSNKAEADTLLFGVLFRSMAGVQSTDGADRLDLLKGWFEAYKQMKSHEADGEVQPSSAESETLPLPEGMGGIYANMLSSMLDHIKKTPEQLSAKNLYQYDNTVITILSHHQPKARQVSSVLAIDYQSATAEQSVQLPMRLDFSNERLAVDAAAVIPVLSLAAPKYAPTTDLAADVMHFGMPESFDGLIPMSVVYDALTRAHLAGFRHMDAERFTPVALTQDAYARQIGAAQVIKFSPSTQDAGKIVGIMLKQLAQDLKAHIDAHPELYADDHEAAASDDGVTPAKIKAAIDNWALINQGHQTDDVGSALSLLQAIQPINSANHFYYYLDGRGQLIGMQFIQSVNQQMQNTRMEVAGQVRFSQKPIAHAYSAKLHQNFDAPDAIDGSAWLRGIRQDMALKSLAEAAREDYQYDNDLYANDESDEAENDGEP